MRILFILFFLSRFAMGASPIEESLYVSAPLAKFQAILERHPELIIDHPSRFGFELYGPAGTAKFLDSMNIPYSQEVHGHFKSTENPGADYPSAAETAKTIKSIVAKYPAIMTVSSIGTSVSGKELLVVKISNNPSVDQIKPEFKYISSMHGDEITGRELMVKFIDDLGKNYGTDKVITDLIDNTEIFIMPSMNPDGSDKKQRGNAKGVDLNRNFPDILSDATSTPNGRQVETVAIMNFQKSRHFSLSANFHGGAVVANYPWDSKFDRHPFDQMVKSFSLAYADLNSEMANSTEFEHGITNGADWYIVRGGMQDWSYHWFNDLQITIELSDIKWPSYSQIPGFYQRNRESLIKYMEFIHQGAGFVINNRPDAKGEVTIKDASGKNLGTYGFTGEFYKVLPEGDYQFEIKLSDGVKINHSMSVTNTIRSGGNIDRL